MGSSINMKCFVLAVFVHLVLLCAIYKIMCLTMPFMLLKEKANYLLKRMASPWAQGPPGAPANVRGPLNERVASVSQEGWGCPLSLPNCLQVEPPGCGAATVIGAEPCAMVLQTM